MRFRLYILLLTLFCFALMAAPRVHADPVKSQEYQIKAAFLYNFIKFVEWPKEKIADCNLITIGIIGKNPFGKAFGPLKDKQVKNKKIIIKQFKSLEESKQTDEQIEILRDCHLLFICRSETKHLKEIIESVKGYNVLTIGDMKDFLELGGIINFLMEEEKVCFEIHNTAAKRAHLDIRSKLLRLAKRTIDDLGLLMESERVMAKLNP